MCSCLFDSHTRPLSKILSLHSSLVCRAVLIVSYSSVLHCTVLYCTVLYCTVLYCTVLYCTVLYCTVLHCTLLYCTVLHCTVLYCTVQYCTALCLRICPLCCRRPVTLSAQHDFNVVAISLYMTPYHTTQDDIQDITPHHTTPHHETAHNASLQYNTT